MKETLRKYFDNLLDIYQRKHNSLPKTCIQDDAADFIYLNKSDDDWAEWKPIEKTIFTDFSKLEKTLETQIHQSIKDYYNSFWFCNLGGKIGENFIELFAVLPNIECQEIEYYLNGYQTAHGHLKFTPIGLETKQSLLVVVENKTGEVFIEDFEVNSFEKIADSLEELISNLVL